MEVVKDYFYLFVQMKVMLHMNDNIMQVFKVFYNAYCTFLPALFLPMRIFFPSISISFVYEINLAFLILPCTVL